MRQLTVADIIRLALPADTRVAAGAEGLNRPIGWARVAGTRPLAAGSLEEGELVIFAALPPALSGESARRLVDLLVETHAAGLLLIQAPPSTLTSAADQSALPVLVAPPTARVAEMERAIVALVVDSRAQLRQRVDETYQRLTRIALEDRGLGALVGALADAMDKLIVIEDEYGTVQEAAAPRLQRAEHALPSLDSVLPALQASTRELPWPGREALRAHQISPTRLALGTDGLERLVLPIVLKRTMAGFLSVIGHRDAFDELDDLVLGPAASVCALELAKQRAVAETEYRLQADVLEAALAGRFGSEAELAARARALGYELQGAHVALVFALDEGRGQSRVAASPSALRPRLLDTLRRVLEAQGRTALIRQQDERVAVFLPAGGVEAGALTRQGEALRHATATAFDATTLSLGVGRPYADVAGLSTGYREAEEALEIGQMLLGGNRTTYFGDLGIRRLLFPLRDSSELRAFYDEFLGALDSYDERHSTELIRTLEGFFAHHGNHVRAAEALHLHRNTLLYRLARIQAISGLDLDDPEVRLAVQVALRLRPVAAARRRSAGPSSDGGPSVDDTQRSERVGPDDLAAAPVAITVGRT